MVYDHFCRSHSISLLDYRRWDRQLRNALLLLLSVVSLVGCRSNADKLNEEAVSARSLLRSERYDLALAKAEDGLDRAERAHKLTFEWQFRLLKVEILLGQRSNSQALSLLDSYGEPPAGAEWAEYRGRAFLLRGFALYLLGRLAEAQDWLSRAAEAAKLASSGSLSAEIELRRGSVLAKQSQPGEARRLFENVIKASTRLHDTYLEANAGFNIGRSLEIEALYDEAIPWFEQAGRLFTKLGANEPFARATENIGTCYFRLGDYDNARSHYEQALEVFARTGDSNEQQRIIGNIGSVSYEAGDYNAAAAAYNRALEIARQASNSKAIADWLGNLATTSIEMKDWEAAERDNDEALDRTRQLEDRRSEPNLRINAARIAMGRGRDGQAEDLFRSVLKSKAEDPSVPLDAHAGLAQLYSRQGSLDTAETEFRSTLEKIDQSASNLGKDEYKLSFAASLIQFYGKYIDFLILNNKPERALEVAESSRSRVLGERIGSNKPVQRFKAEDFQHIAAQTHAVLLEYWLGTTQNYFWVITSDRIRCHTLPPRTELRPLIESYRAYTMGPRNPLEVAAETGQKLYRALLAPVENDAPKADRFIIVPDGDLHAFNFESLPAGSDATRFWIEHATVAIAPSLNYLVASHRSSRPKTHPERGLLIGDPVPAAAEYPRLSYAGREMDAIALAMGGSKQLKGAEARPASYAESHPERFDFIHFAAHAVANPTNPLDSAVILSGTPETFRLLARDVLKQPLSAGVVTISACRSAGAKTYAGEGLVGFAWAFLKAGAENVVAGLWDVNDQSTAKLMTGLYTNIAAGDAVSDALRKSKLALIQGGGAWAKPLYWAPFELYMGAYR
jgi:CHAT domain-containing protein/Tfp pilus assembly protein PilF